MLGGIADHRHDHDTDEQVGKAEGCRGVLDRADQDLAHPHDQQRDHGHDADGHGDRPRRAVLLALLVRLLAAKQMGVAAQHEHQAEQVDHQEEHRHDDAESHRPGDEVALARDGEHRRHQDGDGGQRHHADLRAHADRGEALDLVLEAAGQERRPQHQQQVADDRAGERGLDHVEHAGAQRHQGDDQLGGIAQGGVEEAADALAETGCQLLGGDAKQTGQRHDGEAGHQEHQQGIVRSSVMQPGGNRHGEQQPCQGGFGHHGAQHLH